MTTILAVEKDGECAVCWDTMTTAHGCRSVNAVPVPKVTRIGDSVIGVAGYSVYCNILQHYVDTIETPSLDDEKSVFSFFLGFWSALHKEYSFVDDQADEDDPSPFADLQAEFLVVNRRGVFRVKEILSTTRFERFCAIGSGAPHAEGALHVRYPQDGSALEVARSAMSAAVAFDVSTGDQVESIVLE
jgi:ATP-dependent protease HslVU (ClpYQ) peptidase subunit